MATSFDFSKSSPVAPPVSLHGLPLHNLVLLLVFHVVIVFLQTAVHESAVLQQLMIRVAVQVAGAAVLAEAGAPAAVLVEVAVAEEEVGLADALLTPLLGPVGSSSV